MSLQVAQHIQQLKPYRPGKSVAEDGIVLNSNENPLGCSPRVILALQEAARTVHRYPSGAAAAELKDRLSSHLGVRQEEIVVGNGSNELIDFLIRAYCLPGDAIVTSRFAFIAYKNCAQIQGVSTIETPVTEECRADLGAMAKAALDPRVKIIFLANPNNPTGTYHRTHELKAFLDEVQKIRGETICVALDYAYWEYVTAPDIPDPIRWLQEYPNLIVLRTFSKAYGLAGLRVGYSVSHSEIAAVLEKIRQPFNVNSMAIVGATAALADQGFIQKAREENERERKTWERELRKMELEFFASQGNFICVDVSRAGLTGVDVCKEAMKHEVAFRALENYGLENAIRISIGTREENSMARDVLSLCVHLGQALRIQ